MTNPSSIMIWRRVAQALSASAVALVVGACAAPQAASGQPSDAALATAATPAPKPSGKWGEVTGTKALSAEGIKTFKPSGKEERISVSPIQVEGQPFKDALRIEVKQPSEQSWDVQLLAPTVAPVAKGDVMLATFYFRTERSYVESAEGDTEFVFEQAAEPWTKSTTYPVTSGREWRKVYARFTAVDDYAPGAAHVIFRLGYPRQLVEIGGVTLENFGKVLALTDLPVTKATYGGEEANAPWRAAADERIDKLRKADFKIVVKDPSGKVVPGAEVSVNMTRHAFKFGTAVQPEIIVNQSNKQYLDLLKELFNFAVPDPDLKWPPLAGEWGGSWSMARAQKAIDWLHENGFEVKGHCLVWPGWRNLPKSLKALENDKSKLRAEVIKHVKDEVGQLKGKVEQWDVMNENFDNHDLMDILGNDSMVEWFQAARATDPAAKLFLNDYAILSGGGGDSPHRQSFEKTIKFLLDKGAPVDGIGMQGHFGNALTAPVDLMAQLDRFGKFKKPIYVTEYDVLVEDEELAANYTRDLLTVMFSHPAAGGFIMWGFWDGSHWKNNSPLYRKDFSAKPAAKAYRDLVLGKWWTRAKGTTDGKGSYGVRAFQGNYEISVKKGEQTVVQKAVLDADGRQLTVTLK